MILSLTERQQRSTVVFVLILLLTPLRSAAIIVSPLILLFLHSIHPFKDWHEVRWLILLWLFTAIVGMSEGTTSWKNVLVSAVIFVPMLYILFARPIVRKSFIVTHFDYIKKVFISILVVINILGFQHWFKYGMDAMEFAYSKHYEGVHGLAMINIFVVLYLGVRLWKGERDKKTVALFVFFAAAIFCCQYGLGMICLFVSLMAFMLLMRKLKLFLSALAVAAVGIWLLSLDAFNYERENIMKAEAGEDARKVIMFQDFYHCVTTDLNFCLVGTGAGGYNSRSALLLSHDYNNPLKSLLGSSSPPHFKKYIESLWNSNIVDFEKHTDGTRNKPYSSMVAIWAEQGIFFFIVFLLLLRKNYRYLNLYRDGNGLYEYVLLLDVFMTVSLISHLWLECSEFIVYCLIRYSCLTQLSCNKEPPG